jgi:DUF971 family protein
MARHAEPPRRLVFLDEDQTLLAIEWRDGHRSPYPLAYLRGWCPCAACQGHGTTQRFVSVPSPRLAGMSQVGAYGLSLQWKDGHATGIHTWETLRADCPCASCGGPREGTPPEVAALVPASIE